MSDGLLDPRFLRRNTSGGYGRRRLTLVPVDEYQLHDSAEGSPLERFRSQSLRSVSVTELPRCDEVPETPRPEVPDQFAASTEGLADTNPVIGKVEDLPSALRHGVGVVCKRGMKPETPNQDDYFIVALGEEREALLYGVLDGHGLHGDAVARCCREHLLKQLLETVPTSAQERAGWINVIGNAFASTQAVVSEELGQACAGSGTTCTIVLQAPNELRLAHLGDCGAVLASRKSIDAVSPCATSPTRTRPSMELDAIDFGGLSTPSSPSSASSWRVLQLTQPHIPDEPNENARILAAGGQLRRPEGPAAVLLPSRLITHVGDLAVSRALGDLYASQYGLTHMPDVIEIPPEEFLEEDEHVILLCSDGVWDYFTPQQAIQVINNYTADLAQEAAEKLALKAEQRWKEHNDVVDDITVVLIWTRPPSGISSDGEG